MNALFAGEVDYHRAAVSTTCCPLMKADENVKLVDVNPLGNQYALRFNSTVKPFDNPKIRQARRSMRSIRRTS